MNKLPTNAVINRLHGEITRLETKRKKLLLENKDQKWRLKEQKKTITTFSKELKRMMRTIERLEAKELQLEEAIRILRGIEE